MSQARHRSEDDIEISRLVRTLRSADQRLEELTAGEVDSVSDSDGNAYLLSHAQREIRAKEAAYQTAIPNALPAHVVLLDADGVIVAVNEAWRQLAAVNSMQSPDFGLGINYLALCDGAWGPDAASAQTTAAGIRLVLQGESHRFAVEYACDTPGGTIWFLLIVTPLDGEARHGAVVMHVDITDRKRDQQSLLQFAAAMDAAVDAIYLTDLQVPLPLLEFPKRNSHISTTSSSREPRSLIGWKCGASVPTSQSIGWRSDVRHSSCRDAG